PAGAHELAEPSEVEGGEDHGLRPPGGIEERERGHEDSPVSARLQLVVADGEPARAYGTVEPRPVGDVERRRQGDGATVNRPVRPGHTDVGVAHVARQEGGVARAAPRAEARL